MYNDPWSLRYTNDIQLRTTLGTFLDEKLEKLVRRSFREFIIFLEKDTVLKRLIETNIGPQTVKL